MMKTYIKVGEFVLWKSVKRHEELRIPKTVGSKFSAFLTFNAMRIFLGMLPKICFAMGENIL